MDHEKPLPIPFILPIQQLTVLYIHIIRQDTRI